MIIVAVWLFGTWCLIKTLLDIYLWVKGNIFDFRVAYLRQLTDPKDLAIVWRSVWSARNIPAAEERRLFEVFAATVGDLVEDGDAQE